MDEFTVCVGYTRHTDKRDDDGKQITHSWVTFSSTLTEVRRRRVVDLLLNLSGYYSWFAMGDVVHPPWLDASSSPLAVCDAAPAEPVARSSESGQQDVEWALIDGRWHAAEDPVSESVESDPVVLGGGSSSSAACGAASNEETQTPAPAHAAPPTAPPHGTAPAAFWPTALPQQPAPAAESWPVKRAVPPLGTTIGEESEVLPLALRSARTPSPSMRDPPPYVPQAPMGRPSVYPWPATGNYLPQSHPMAPQPMAQAQPQWSPVPLAPHQPMAPQPQWSTPVPGPVAPQPMAPEPQLSAVPMGQAYWHHVAPLQGQHGNGYAPTPLVVCEPPMPQTPQWRPYVQHSMFQFPSSMAALQPTVDSALVQPPGALGPAVESDVLPQLQPVAPESPEILPSYMPAVVLPPYPPSVVSPASPEILPPNVPQAGPAVVPPPQPSVVVFQQIHPFSLDDVGSVGSVADDTGDNDVDTPWGSEAPMPYRNYDANLDDEMRSQLEEDDQRDLLWYRSHLHATRDARSSFLNLEAGFTPRLPRRSPPPHKCQDPVEFDALPFMKV